MTASVSEAVSRLRIAHLGIRNAGLRSAVNSPAQSQSATISNLSYYIFKRGALPARDLIKRPKENLHYESLSFCKAIGSSDGDSVAELARDFKLDSNKQIGFREDFINRA